MGRVVDMTGVGDYKPAPDGVYTAEFTGGEWVQTKGGKNPGSDMYKGKWTITDEIEGASGRVVYRNWNALPNSAWVFFGDAVALGYPEDQLTGEVDWDLVIPQLVGRRAVITVVTRVYTYPDGHAKAGQQRYSNEITKLEQADIPEMLAPAARRRG